ncbi:hypothetical protein [Helicobacter pylori]
MVSLFALYYGVILKTELAFNSVFMGNACVFLAVFGFFKTRSF